jgi:hypothetical protein
MNYGEYMRRKNRLLSKTIGFQNGQDASQVTLKAQARAATVETSVAVKTSFSKLGGSIGNIGEKNQSTNVPTAEVCSGGAVGVAYGENNRDATGSVVAAAQHCAVCSDAPSSAPYNIVIKLPVTPVYDSNGNFLYNEQRDCGVYVDYNPTLAAYNTYGIVPGGQTCCSKDTSQLYRNNSELIADQGRQEAQRRKYNLPNKLQGLRGPVITGRT